MALRPRKASIPKHDRSRTALLVAAGLFLVLGLAIGVELWRSAGTDESSKTGSAASVDVPSGPAVVAGVEVVQVLADSGRVPLNTPVEQFWRLVNTGSTVVTLGKPTIKVLEGC